MKKEWFLFIVFLLLPYTIKCDEGGVKTMCIGKMADCMVIEVDKPSEQYAILDNIISDIEFIKLEMRAECIIGGISQLEIYNDRIYILDNISEAIFIFTINGKFLNSINKKGKGPGEYTTIKKFIITNDKIVVADNDHLKILFYTIDGSFLKEKKLDFNFRDFYVTEHNFYFFNNNAPQLKEEYKSKLLCFDSDFNFVGGNFEYDKHDEYRGNNFYIFNKGIQFTHGLDDNIYKISGDTLTPVCKIDFGGNGYDKSKSLRYSYLFSDEFKHLEYSVYPSNFIENDNFLYFHYLFGRYRSKVFFNKKNRECKQVYKTNSVTLLNEIFSPRTVYNNSFVSTLDPSILINKRLIQSKILNEKLSNKFKLLEEQVSPNDNPIIVLFKIDSNAIWYQ